MKPGARSLRREAGTTLIETLVAIVVLSFGLIAVTNLFIVATAANGSGTMTTAAANLASEQLDALRVVPFTVLTPGGDLNNDSGLAADCPAVAPGAFSCYQDVPGAARIRLRWTIAPAGPNSLAITVDATPIAALGGGHGRVVLTTIRTCTSRDTVVPPGGAACPPVTFP